MLALTFGGQVNKSFVDHMNANPHHSRLFFSAP